MMVSEFEEIIRGINVLLAEWTPKLIAMSEDQITNKRNEQNRNIKQILGHMIDSVSNNTHRIIHLQYQQDPLVFPNYATNGNNDGWIAIQNYENESWRDLVQLWKYTHRHIIHVIKHVEPEKLENCWDSQSEYGLVSLKSMIIDFLRHMKLHMEQIEALINV